MGGADAQLGWAPAHPEGAPRRTPATHARLIRRLCQLAFAVFALAALDGSAVRADAASEARVRYERALKFYDDGVYDAALVELTRAYELHPSYRLIYNIAQTRVAMRDYAGAIEAFSRYLREGAGQLSSERVTSVRAQLSELQQRVGRLTIETDVPDAEVSVDDVVVGSSPLTAAVVVNAGVRRVTVRHPDYPARSQRASIAGGEQQRLSLPLRPNVRDDAAQAQAAVKPALPASEPVAPVSVPAPTPPRSPIPIVPRPSELPNETDRTFAWIATGVTSALAAGAIVLGVMALNQNSALKELRGQPGQDVAAFNDDRAQMNRVAAIADGLAVATLVAAGATTWLWLRDGGSRSDTAAAQPRTAPRLGVSLAAGGARLAGEF